MSVQVLLSVLVSFAAKSAAILVLAAVACRLFRQLGAPYRHLFWAAGFCAILVLPILSAVLPRQNVAVLPPPAPSKALPSLAPPAVAIPAPLRAELVESESNVRESPAPTVAAPAMKAAPAHPETVVLLVWLAGVIVVLGQYAVSLFLLSRSAARAEKADPERYTEIAGRAGLTRQWKLLLGDVAGMPSPKTWGVFRPVVAMPARSSEWPAEQFETVLMHELIHVQRLDFLTQSLATLACALNWFNPFAWAGLRAMRVEAEVAADDGVLLAGVKPSVYALALLQAASEFQSSSSPFLSAGVPLMKQSKIESRVRAILSVDRRVRRIHRLGAMALIGASLLVALPCAALQVTAQTPTSKSAVQPPSTVQSVSATIARKPQKTAHARKRVAGRHTNGSSQQIERYQAEIDTLKVELAQQRRELAMMRTAMAAEAQNRAMERADAAGSQRAMQRENVEQARANLAEAQARIDSLHAKLFAEKAHLNETQARYKAGIETQDSVNTAAADLQIDEAQLRAAQAAYQAAQAKSDAERTVVEAQKNDQRASLHALLSELRSKLTREQALVKQGYKAKGDTQLDLDKVESMQAEIDRLNRKLANSSGSGK